MSERRRFACELADRLGQVDVDAMLGQMTPEDFEERWAASRLRLSESWQQAGMISATVVNMINWIASGMSGRKVDESEIAQWWDAIPMQPWLRKMFDDETKPAPQSAEAMRAQAKADFG